MKHLIVGLGNIGEKYKNTRHNIGFEIIESIAQKYDSLFRKKTLAYRCDIKIANEQVVLIKPTTFVNLSGQAVVHFMQKEKIIKQNLLVLLDDIALPFGKIRIKERGSDGGHNGLKSINSVLNTNDYARLRFGVGNDFERGQQADYVLSSFTKEENKDIKSNIEIASRIIETIITEGVAKAMNKWN